jgi:hypothetical protein
MSERTDQIIDDHLQQRPAARRAYQHDPTLRHQVEWARRLLAVMELVMQREGIAADAGERVLNEVMHVGLGDWEQEKLSRERLLLLADMTADFRDKPFGPTTDRPTTSEETSG